MYGIYRGQAGGNENSVSRRLHFRLRRNERDATEIVTRDPGLVAPISSIHCFVARFCSLSSFFFLDTLSEVINEEKVGESENVVSVLSFERFFKFLKIYIKLMGIIMRFVIFSFLSLNVR